MQKLIQWNNNTFWPKNILLSIDNAAANLMCAIKYTLAMYKRQWLFLSIILPAKLFKVTRHLCFKNSKNLQLLDVQACNSANRAAFQNPTKRPFVGFWKDGLLAELKARMSWGRKFLLFLKQRCLVTLRILAIKCMWSQISIKIVNSRCIKSQRDNSLAKAIFASYLATILTMVEIQNAKQYWHDTI